MRCLRVQPFPGPLSFTITFLVPLLTIGAVASLHSSALGQSAPAEALTASIQETLLGPGVPGAMFVVSPDGGHYAAPAMRGTHEVVVIDGVDGPQFDHAGHTR